VAEAGGNLVELRGRDGQVIATLKHPSNVHSVSWSPDGLRLAVGFDGPAAADERIQLWTPAGQAVATMASGQGIVTGLAWLPDGSQLATGGQISPIRLWDRNGQPVGTITTPQGARWLAWSPDGALLAGAVGSEVLVWHPDGTVAARVTASLGQTVTSVAWSPDGTMLASSDLGNGIRVWSRDLQPLDTVLVPSCPMQHVAWAPDGTALAFVGNDGKIRLWRLR
jgi:WD40 repeat protein